MTERTAPGSNPTRALLDRLAGRAKAALLWERAWPAAVAALILVGLFLTASWLGFWINSPRWVRALGLALFALAFLWPVWLAVRLRAPTRAEALARVDQDSGLPHRPAATLDDALANAESDATTRALWAVHQRRAAAAARGLRVAAPRPRVALHDRYAVRGGVLVAVIAAAFVAGPQKYPLVASAFDFRAAGAVAAGYRLDAWIDPPPYTGRPPVLLRRSGDGRAAGERQRVEAPAGSTVIVRMSDGAGVVAEAAGRLAAPEEEKPAEAGAEKPPAAPARPAAASSDTEQKWILKGDGQLTLKRLGSVVAAFDLVAIPDEPPRIALRGELRPNARGSLTLPYRVEDDYGVVRADAEFAGPRIGARASKRSLVEPPRMPLGLPAGAGGSGDAETTADLSEHPWAGARVTLNLVARDEAGNEGRSEPAEVILPQRQFVKPLARAIVEQRRLLALYPDERARVAIAIDALMIEPERFQTGAGPYLGLRTIYRRLASARTDDALRDVLAFMWEMALRLEEGDLSEAERDLRAAQQALREALDRGASEEEIRRLMEQLRAAMDRFLQEFADRQRQQENEQDAQNQNQPNPNERTISSQDLNRMLDRMEEMARSGNMADAQRMLDQLQNLLENLRTARRGQNQMSREMNRSLNQLDQMMRDQQELRDRTYRRSQRSDRGQQGQQGQQGQRRPGQSGEPQQGENGEEGDNPEGLRQRQEALRRQLEDLQRRMRQFGMKPEQGFEDAEGAMREAEGQLGQGEEGQGPAADAQGRALEGLRRGAQSMAQQMQQGDQPGEQAGQGDPNGPGQQGRDSANPDPLGREARDRGDNSRSVYDPAGVPAAQRAQRVLEELRRRLSDPARSRDELDYLERLLRRY